MKRWKLKMGWFEKPGDIFEAVKNGSKTIETRQLDPGGKKDYAQIAPGDVLEFTDLTSGETLEKQAVWVHVYKSVKDMADNEDPERILPGAGSAENVVKIFEKLKKKWGKGYAQKLERNGIAAIGI